MSLAPRPCRCPPPTIDEFGAGKFPPKHQAAAPISVPGIDPGGTTLFRPQTALAGHGAYRCERRRLGAGEGNRPLVCSSGSSMYLSPLNRLVTNRGYPASIRSMATPKCRRITVEECNCHDEDGLSIAWGQSASLSDGSPSDDGW